MILENVIKRIDRHFLNLTERGFVYGPQGKMLLKNLENHWLLRSVIMPRYNVFLSDEFSETLAFLNKYSLDNVPFGFATTGSIKHVWNQSLISTNRKVPSHKTAKVAIMTDETESKELFHRIQKEHKTWWRKLAQDPSRFKLTEGKRIKNLDSVDIEAQFPFGNITVETIIYHHDPRKLFTQVENDKIDIAHMQMVEHVVSLDWGCLALLCDAHKSKNLDEAHIHSKLSPYKVAFYIAKPESVSNTEEDLNRFVLYLNNMLRTKGVSTILTSAKEIIDICLVPFIVKVDETSLKNGIIHVTSRSTTLSEAIHITNLVKFILMRC